ncbi:MAG: hypothetical protein WBR18_11700 [Anaerolineales bacterium]
MTTLKRPSEILNELQAAHQAREQGNEGKARVCARRAAGWAISLRYDDPKTSVPVSAYRVLQWFQVQDFVPQRLKLAAARLTTQINEGHNLPHQQDPLEDARNLVEAMLADREEQVDKPADG